MFFISRSGRRRRLEARWSVRPSTQPLRGWLRMKKFRTDRKPGHAVLPLAVESVQAAFSSPGNNDKSPASDAAQTPRSVIKPVTSRAGVTSNP